MSFNVSAAIAQFASTGPSMSVTDTFGPFEADVRHELVTNPLGGPYVYDDFFLTIDSFTARTIDLSAVLAAAGTTYVTIRYAVQPSTKFTLLTNGDPDYVNYTHGPPGNVTPTALAHGWIIANSLGNLDFSADTFGDLDVAAEDISIPAFSLQPYDPSFGNLFAGYLLRPTALTWASQDPTNDANRVMFSPSDLTSVDYQWLAVQLGSIGGTAQLIVDTYAEIGSPSFSTGLMCVL
jgi:hypothetical protein